MLWASADRHAAARLSDRWAPTSVRRILIAIPVLFGITRHRLRHPFDGAGSARRAHRPRGTRLDDAGTDRGDPQATSASTARSYVRYARWLGLQPIVATFTGEKAVPASLQGNLGYTLSTRRPVAEEIAPAHRPDTPAHGPARCCIALLVGIPFGVISAVKQYGKLDYVLTSVTMVLISTPTFVLGLILIYLFGVQLRLLPIGGMQTLGKPFYDRRTSLAHISSMPALILGFAYAAPLMRYTRSSMLEVLGSEYVTTARAKGLRGRVVLVRHGLRNALIPIITRDRPPAARARGRRDHHRAGVLVAGDGPARRPGRARSATRR